jgi:hypothetical protein
MEKKAIGFFWVSIVFLLLANSTMVFAQAQVNDTLELQFSDSLVAQLQQQDSYASYLNVNAQPTGLNDWWKQIMLWLKGKYGRNTFAGYFLAALPLLFVVFVLVLIALKVTGLSFRGVISPKNGKVHFAEGSDEEIIQRTDLDDLVEQAKIKGEFRKAIRLLYLQLLKMLDEQEIIIWDANKTNREYLYAIKESAIQRNFKQAIHIYEQTWYGNKPWNRVSYEENFKEMVALKQRLG